MVKIYKPKIVTQLEEFYGDTLYAYNKGISVKDHLSLLSEKLWLGIQDKHDPVYAQFNNYNKQFIGQSRDQLKEIDITKEDCYQTIANEYGFENWNALKILIDLKYNLNFEKAVEFVLSGNRKSLQQIIIKEPDIVTERSPYGHKATLLHYCGSNGVEFWRQKVPLNLPEIAQCLLDSGADLNAKMLVYGGEHDTLSLLNTSAHPHEAGIIHEMQEILGRTS